MTTINNQTTDQSRNQTVALSKLTASKDNVRRVESEAGLTELVASIRAHGLLQNLTVRPNDKGKYEVVAGARRLAALRTLANEKGSGWTKKSPIPVLILDQHNDTEISLAENTVRQNMHVADQVEAFRKLIEDDAMTPEQVADRFGISTMTVRRRIKLAKVSPRIMDEFRVGQVTLGQMEALAIADDHGEQESAFFELPDWNRDERHIRARLTQEKIRADNRLVRFVGVEAYVDAGGAITRDLFSEDSDLYLDDKPLVMTLAMTRLEEEAQAIQTAEGWKWAEFYLSESDARERLPVIASHKREHTDEESAEVAALSAYFEENEGAYDAGQMTEEEAAEYEAKLARLDAIDTECMGYDTQEKALAGIRLHIDHDGQLGVRSGLLKPAEQHELAQRRRERERAEREAEAEARGEAYMPPEANNDPLPPWEEPEPAEGYSQALSLDLTHLRTAALAYEVSQRPDVALALIVHALAGRCLYANRFGHHDADSLIRISGTKQGSSSAKIDPDNAAAFTALSEAQEKVQAKLPADRTELLAWCLAASRKTLLDVLATCVADQLDAVRFDSKPHYAADRIAEAVSLDMAAWFTPSETFLKRITKKMMASAVTEAGCAPEVASAILGLPKAEAVQTAQEALQGKGWLPPALRMQTAILATTSEAAAAEVTSEGGEIAGDGADIGDTDPPQAPDDGGGQTGSAEALIAAE
ncbi:MAG: ParB/RepB/Spo0J family partition protein [Beijerinckiaceae bacterium]|nr:ParB/RepB/Spo0J family partition protein [Beijerinckiaceae bacterium]